MALSFVLYNSTKLPNPYIQAGDKESNIPYFDYPIIGETGATAFVSLLSSTDVPDIACGATCRFHEDPTVVGGLRNWENVSIRRAGLTLASHAYPRISRVIILLRGTSLLIP